MREIIKLIMLLFVIVSEVYLILYFTILINR